MRRDQIGGKHDRRVRYSRGRGRQRVVHRADHEGQHDRRAMAAPARHRPVGAVDGERREAEAEEEGHGDAEEIPFKVTGDMPASEGDDMHGKDARAHHEAAGFRRQRKMAAADLEADQTGDDGDDEHRAGRDRLEARVQGRIECQDRDEGRGPQRRAGADGGHEQPADPRGAGGSPGAREMAHADPGSEQAH